MSTHRLARVRWRMGQVLRPEHLRALEDSAITRARFHLALDGLPRAGLARLSWQDALLRHEGVFSVRELVACMPSGRVVALGEDAELTTGPLELVGDGRAVPIYLHLLVGSTPLTPPSADGEVPVTRGLARLAISRDEALAESVEHLKIASLREDDQGHWEIVGDYLPMLVTCWGTPWLRPRLEALEGPLDLLRSRLSQQLSLHYLEGTSQAGTRSCLKEIYAFQALLADMRAGLDRHPYWLYSQLRGLFFEIFFYQNAAQRLSPDLATAPYQHDDLEGCLGALIDGTIQISEQEWGGPRIASFERSGELFSLRIPGEITEELSLFLLLRKPRVGMEIDAGRLKLGARSRLHRLHRLSLKGVGLAPAPLPAFSQQLSPEVEFYRIEKDNEWALAFAEGELAFYAREGLESLDAALCWSLGGGSE